MTDEQKTIVKGYVTTLNSNITAGDLLDLVVDTVSDRVLLYLNDTVIADNMLRVIAQVVVAAYKKTTAEGTSLGVDQHVSSVSDNGQTVSYTQLTAQYFGSQSDQELFTGFEQLLAPYRRIHVIASQL